MTRTVDRDDSSEQVHRGFLDHAQVLLTAQEQTDWHLEIEATEVIEDILGTLNETGPYAFTVSPTMQDGRLRAHLCSTRDAIREAYIGVHSRRNLISWRSPTQIAGTWYTFHDAVWNVLFKDDGLVHDVQALLLFPTLGKRGITGEMVWPRIEPVPETNDPNRRVDLHVIDTTWFDHLRTGDVDGAVGLLTPTVQMIVRDYVDPTPERTHVELDGADAVRAHLRAFSERYAVEAIDVVHRQVEDWYAFTEMRWTVRSLEDDTRWSWLCAEFGVFDNGTTMGARLGHGTEPVQL